MAVATGGTFQVTNAAQDQQIFDATTLGLPGVSSVIIRNEGPTGTAKVRIPGLHQVGGEALLDVGDEVPFSCAPNGIQQVFARCDDNGGTGTTIKFYVNGRN